LGILFPPRSSAPLTIGLPSPAGHGPRRGFHVPRTRDTTGMGAPFTPRPSGVHATSAVRLVAACRLHQRPGPVTRVFLPSSRAIADEASQGVHFRSPVRSSPYPVAPPDGAGGPWACPLELRTPSGQDPPGARRGGDRSRTLIGSYASGITGLQPASSLNMRDLVSHDRGLPAPPPRPGRTQRHPVLRRRRRADPHHQPRRAAGGQQPRAAITAGRGRQQTIVDESSTRTAVTEVTTE
jgi:hypothetical protein